MSAFPPPPSTIDFVGYIQQTLTPDELLDVLSGKTRATGANHTQGGQFYQRIQNPTLIGFFPDPGQRREVAITEYRPNLPRLVPFVFLTTQGEEWGGDPSLLTITTLDRHPLIRIEGDTRFLRVLLWVAQEALKKDQQFGPDREKWAIALKLYGWLREEKQKWNPRVLELAEVLNRPPLLPNTLEKKVRRLLDEID